MPLLFFNTNDAALISLSVHHKADTPPQRKAENCLLCLEYQQIEVLTPYAARDSPLTYTTSKVDDPEQDSLNP